MELKLGYKKTEVGVIPKEWEVNSLDNIGRVIRGASPRPKGDKRFYGGSIPRLMVEDVTRDRKYVTPSIDFLTQEGAKRSRPCKRGTLTIVCSGTPTVVGLPSLLAVDACIHDGMLALVDLGHAVEPEFLFYQLTSLQEQLHAAATHGGTFVNLTTTGFGAFVISLPTSPEQLSIATALSDVDALITSLDRLIAKKCDLKRAAMQELLTGKRRLSGFSGGWKNKTFGEIFDYYSTATNSRSDLSADAGDTYYIHYGDIHTKYHGHLDFSKVAPPMISRQLCPNACLLQNGDWIMADASEDFDGVGKAIEISGLDVGVQAVAGLHTFLLREKTPTFSAGFKGHLGSLFGLHQQMLRVATGLKVYGVSKANLKALTLPVPSFEEQSAIATILSDMDSEITALERKLDKTRQLKQGMMQELLTGRVRLV